MSGDERTGVMDAEYARRRGSGPLAFRYRTRAALAFQAARERLGAIESPKVLDLGSAEGRTLLCLRSLCGEKGDYVGVEISESLIGAAPPFPGNVRLVHGDICNLPATIAPRSFDLCIALAVLEHVDDPLAAVRGAYQSLRPGGVLVMSCPNPFWDRAAGLLRLTLDEYHVQRMDARRMRALTEQAGFSEVEYFPFMWAPIGVLAYVRMGVPPRHGLEIDRMIRRLRFLNWSFVNQCVIARRPSHEPSTERSAADIARTHGDR